MTNRLQTTKDAYRAYENRDRGLIDGLLADDFTFFSPADPGIDRSAYFERCWPNAGNLDAFEYERLIEHDDEVIVTYECTRTDGSRFRNTEVLTFDGDRISRVEVYFGWDL
jgi:ketosteroid isomerase-like protein